ncbi:type II toxin-antitoxin system HicB family antitoxin [Enterovirga aerilata]|uniref:HicB family protein n=1 Tax=Enterovirga aerilata TaxID=2730920 RepID=A0A849HUI8_9HYPH|nr:type II toxin-antitoxin system HicB family antitoxin [Enterovirga sp. DB1703]NNM71166.1 HicB family protein [Enterovirga sp. DB1703]
MSRVVMLVHEENGRLGASFPDLPGCTTVAPDADSLVRKAAEVVAFHVGGMVEDGLDLPRFRSLSELRADPDFVEDARDAMVVLLDVDLPSRAVRVNITVDENVLKRIDRAASAAGETRSGFLVAAAKARLQAAE